MILLCGTLIFTRFYPKDESLYTSLFTWRNRNFWKLKFLIFLLYLLIILLFLRDWYNLEKSKRVKAFRCGEFDACIEKAEATQGTLVKKREKYARREDAILHALELERKQLASQYQTQGFKPGPPGNISGKSSKMTVKYFYLGCCDYIMPGFQVCCIQNSSIFMKCSLH